MAGTVALELREGVCCAPYALDYRADPGERNDLTIASAGEGSVRVQDQSGIVAGAGCQLEASSGATAALCTFDRDQGLGLATVWLGDRDDRATILGDAVLYGGRGDDRLRTEGDSGSLFAGGPGDDVMTGAGYSTVFDEGVRPNGSDTMTARPSPISRDDPRYVWVDYGDRREPVLADLRRGRNAGEAGERDVLGPTVNAARGGSGGDRLIGDEGDNQLMGGGGADVLTGGRGDDQLAATPRGTRLLPGQRVREQTTDRLSGGPGGDTLEGSAGPNRLAGGPGNDGIWAAGGADSVLDRDGYVDQLHCGRGHDRVRSDSIDFAGGCELPRFRRRVAFPITVDPITIECKYGLPCDYPWVVYIGVACQRPPNSSCRGSVGIEAPGQPVAQAPFAIDPGDTAGYVELEVTQQTLGFVERRDPSGFVVVTSSSGKVVSVPLAKTTRGAFVLPLFPRRPG